jgi:serine/threonine-protein phosphatase PGAM5
MSFQALLRTGASLSTVCGTVAAGRGIRQVWCDEPEQSKHEFKFPKSQLFQPNKPYPQWDPNWDFRGDDDDDDEAEESNNNKEGTASRSSRKQPPTASGATRHILLIRHGQYDETYSDDEKRILTAIGREQAAQTGKRLNEMITHEAIDKYGMKNNKTIQNLKINLHVSNMARAKETASIIQTFLPPNTKIHPPNSLLNEGTPCHVVPEGRSNNKKPAMKTKSVHRDSARIEAGFRDIFYRDQSKKVKGNKTKKEESQQIPPTLLEETANKNNNSSTGSASDLIASVSKEEEEEVKHIYDVVVCHGNVIRYFAMRALQLPPEAWLRLCTFNCSITYLIVRPNGSVSLRTLGDMGHLDMDHVTFSGHHGIDW